MKLRQSSTYRVTVGALLVLAAGCATREAAPVDPASADSTPAITRLTSAEDERAAPDGEAPRVGKAQRALDVDVDALDAKRPRRTNEEPRGGFGGWKK
jgi:hypothetical protein